MFLFMILFFIIYVISFSYLFYIVKGLEFDLNILLDRYYDLFEKSYKRGDKND